ncbi:DUF2318 domain-containing protein [Candidatus Woesearchaeota archaeon]|nr:DUF2318 domain-containing protein [Candidatus Woesearchaeota archaeon]
MTTRYSTNRKMKREIILSFLALFSIFLVGCTANSASLVDTSNTEDVISIPMSELSTNTHYYTHYSNGVEVKYFAVLDSNGNVKTALDGCEVCGGAKGYRQVGDDMICNNCGRSFKIDQLGTKNTGRGCWPGYLPHEVEGDNIIIDKSDLESSKNLFI